MREGEAEIVAYMDAHRWRFWPGIIAAAVVSFFGWGQTRRRVLDAVETWVFGQPVPEWRGTDGEEADRDA